MDKNDIAISPRSTYFNVQISTVNIHSHCSQMFGQTSCNRLSVCPLRFRIASPTVPIELGCALVNRNSWGRDPKSLGAYISAYYNREQSLFV